MIQLLTDVRTKLTEISDLNYIDTDWGQLDLITPPVKYPCALVDIVQGQFSDQSRGHQIGILEVLIRIADMPLTAGSTAASDAQKERALEVFNLIAYIHSILHGWHGSSHYGPLTRNSIRKARRQDGIREYQIGYRVQLSDASGVKEQTKASVSTITINTKS